MKKRHLLLIFFFALFFLFYPGDSYYIKIFSLHRELFAREEKKQDIKMKPIPYLSSLSWNPEVSSAGIYIIDLDSFTPLYEKNINSRFLPASITKVVTALVAYDTYQLDDVLVVRRVVSEGQKMGLVKGEKITFENLLYGLLVHSGNDAAYVLADNYQGGFDDFVKAMNKKASQLGARNSRFKNPAGFDDFTQYTTPYDLALFSRELLKDKQLSKIVSTKDITVSDIDFKYFHQLQNINKLLGNIPGIGGLKTGYTENAGENLVSFYKKNGHQSLIVILKSEDRFEDTKNIVEWINGNVSYITL